GSWLGHLSAAGCRRVSDGERARLVVDVHGIAHEPDVAGSLRERVDRPAPGGLLVLECHHRLPPLLSNLLNTFRHGHWSYFSVEAVRRLAERLGLTVVAVERVDLFGGSVQVSLRHTAAGAVPDASVCEVLDDEAAAGLADPVRLAALQRAASVSA